MSRSSSDPLLEVKVTPGRVVNPLGNTVRIQFLVDIRPVASNPQKISVDWRFVIDRSTSMADASRFEQGAESKIELVSEAVALLAGQLKYRDRSMLIAFDNNAELIVPHGRANPIFRRQLQRAARNVSSQGGTAFHDALEMALAPSAEDNALTRILFMTDGESNTPEDMDRTLELADRSRERGIPWLIYATGTRYSESYLNALAARSGAGSFYDHVSDVANLERQMLGELAFLRKTSVDRLRVEGDTRGGSRIISVTRFMPSQQEVDLDGLNHFRDTSGALDILRGQQYLIEVEVDNPREGESELFELTFKGRSLDQGIERFVQPISLQARFGKKVSNPHPDVVKIKMQMAARAQSARGNYERSADLYDQTGDRRMSNAMRTLSVTAARGGDFARDASRASMTLTSRATSVSMTGDLSVLDRYIRDADSTPSGS